MKLNEKVKGSSLQKIYENEDFLVVNKPIGMEFHGESGVISILRSLGEEVFGIHRLDKETSGLLILAKNKLVQKEISELFASKKMKKIYLALSLCKPKKKMGTIKGDLEKGRGGNYYLKASTNHPSITDFVSGHSSAYQLRFFILRPRTGKTHQLRVVLKSLGSPILGDSRYGGDKANRMYLHACFLSFEFRGQEFRFFEFPKDDLYKQLEDEIYSLWESDIAKKILKVSKNELV